MQQTITGLGEGSCQWTRRSAFALLASCLLGGLSKRLGASTSPQQLDGVGGLRPLGPASYRFRRYQVNATVVFVSIPLFSKVNVGGACAIVEQGVNPEGAVTGLQFGAGSWPDQLKGFNRFGMTEEVVRENRSGIAESAYLSFMTTAREKNFSEARDAYLASPNTLVLTVAHGRSTASASTAEIEQRQEPANYAWSKCPDLIDRLRRELPFTNASVSAEHPGRALPTFLFSVRRAILNGPGKNTDLYVHNAKVYRLRTESHVDSHSGHLIVEGHTSLEGDHSESEFRLWVALGDDSALPSRIEFRPKSFLKLTLEPATDTNTVHPFRPLFTEEKS